MSCQDVSYGCGKGLLVPSRQSDSASKRNHSELFHLFIERSWAYQPIDGERKENDCTVSAFVGRNKGGSQFVRNVPNDSLFSYLLWIY